jgi:hypothetical protein
MVPLFFYCSSTVVLVPVPETLGSTPVPAKVPVPILVRVPVPVPETLDGYQDLAHAVCD